MLITELDFQVQDTFAMALETKMPWFNNSGMHGANRYFVDFLTFLVGAPPMAVEGHALPDAGRYHQDNVVLTFTFPDGSLGTLTYLANGDKAFPKERIEVFSAGRVAVLDDFRTLELAQHGKRKLIRSPLRQDKGHRLEWEAFAQAILRGGNPPIPYTHLFAVTQATFAAVESLRTHQPVMVNPSINPS